MYHVEYHIRLMLAMVMRFIMETVTDYEEKQGRWRSMINSLQEDHVAGKKGHVLIKSRYRVQKHGEVFTPQWVIDKMLAIPGIKEKTEDVFATFLEPSAGEGAFLLAIEEIKLRFVTDNYNKDLWNSYALWALSSIYGIEFLKDNVAIARQNMLRLFLNHYEASHNTRLSKHSNLYKTARTIIWANVVQGDALTHKNLFGECITFSHWRRIPNTHCKVRRTPFTYSSLLTDDKQINGGTQLSLFKTGEQPSNCSMIDTGKTNAMQLQQYAIVDIEQVWREEKENV